MLSWLCVNCTACVFAGKGCVLIVPVAALLARLRVLYKAVDWELSGQSVYGLICILADNLVT